MTNAEFASMDDYYLEKAISLFNQYAEEGVEAVERIRGKVRMGAIQIDPPKLGPEIGGGGFSVVHESAEPVRGMRAAVRLANLQSALEQDRTIEEIAATFARPVWMSYDPATTTTFLTPIAFTNYSGDGGYFATCSPIMTAPLSARMPRMGDHGKRVLYNILSQSARAHKLGYVIGDIKSDNIMIGRRDSTKIIDFDGAHFDYSAEEIPADILYSPINETSNPRTPHFASRQSLRVNNHTPTRIDDVESMAVVLADLMFGIYGSPSENASNDPERFIRAREQFAGNWNPTDRTVSYASPAVHELLSQAMFGKYAMENPATAMRKFATDFAKTLDIKPN